MAPSVSAALAPLHSRAAVWQPAGVKESCASDPDVTSAVASEADSAAVGPAADSEGAELTAEDYQQLTPEEFAAVADVYIGGLWTRIERGLREAEGEEFDYEVKLERGALLVSLPYDGLVVIRKDPQQRMLVVENNLFEPFEDKSVQEFRPCGEQCWMSEDEQSITDFIASALTQYLKTDVKVSL